MKMLRVFVMLLAAMVLSTLLIAEEAPRTGMILDMDGAVSVRDADGVTVPAEIGMELGQGDILTTGPDAFVLVRLDGIETATVEIDAGSQMLISELVMDRDEGTQNTLLDLAIGKVLIKTERLHSDGSKFEVKTPTSVVGVRGTTFAVEVEALD